MKAETNVIDKSTWGEGPWQQEPDRVDWIHAGFACLALRNHHGNLCGYVGVPANHPAYGVKYDDVAVDVHGGLTYTNKCCGPICHTPGTGMPDDVWWLGFDCGHLFDFSPGAAARERQMFEDLRAKGDPKAELFDRYRSERFGTHEVYRDLPYVRDEVNSLADQLAAMGAKP